MVEVARVLELPEKKRGPGRPPGSKKSAPRTRIATLERALEDAYNLLSTMYIPGPNNEVTIDGCRVYYRDRAEKKKRLVERINNLLYSKGERVD